MPVNAGDVLKDIRQKQRRDGFNNLEAAVLADLYNPKRAGMFAAFLHGRKYDDLRFSLMPRGVVAELGGSTSHLASLARERGIPMVLGVLDATRHIPDGSQVAVDGVAGVVRWLR